MEPRGGTRRRLYLRSNLAQIRVVGYETAKPQQSQWSTGLAECTKYFVTARQLMPRFFARSHSGRRHSFVCAPSCQTSNFATFSSLFHLETSIVVFKLSDCSRIPFLATVYSTTIPQYNSPFDPNSHHVARSACAGSKGLLHSKALAVLEFTVLPWSLKYH